jgi:hypothetical protein
MVQLLKEFDSQLDNELRDALTDYVEPMPFIMI